MRTVAWIHLSLLTTLALPGFPIKLTAAQIAESSPPNRPARSAEEARTVRPLFEKHCSKCHGANGTGQPARDRGTEIPDFHSAAWQARRSDAQLLASIVGGKGTVMPSWENKLSKDQARILVAYVRTFAPTQKNVADESSPRFDEDFQRLEQQYAKSHKEFQKLSQAAEAPPRTGRSKTEARTSSASAPPADSRAIFGARCGKCHGETGTGEPARDQYPEIPDFTDPTWQARHNDAELRTRILEGKGDGMPAWRGKISKEQASALVAVVRAFANQAKTKPAPPAEREETSSSASFFVKLVTWVGKFHPPIVSFPIALLVSAVLAELLTLRTPRPLCEAAGRFCLWIGAGTALVAAMLGWCHAGFHLADPSWILTTHRWLGTTTACSAGFALLVSEWSRHAARPHPLARRLVLFSVGGLVLATGFFGGALVFGLNHYDWPP